MTAAPPRTPPDVDGEPIDPRMQARRVEVLRAKGQRRVRLLLFVLAFLALLGIVWLAVESPLFDVDHVEVEGSGAVPVEQVLAAAHVSRGDALALVDTGAVRARVEALPQIASASVTRSFPNTVHIAVTERERAAWVVPPGRRGRAGNGREVVFLDRGGRVIERGARAPDDLPEVRGLGAIPDVGEQVHPAAAVTLLGRLPNTLRQQVAAVVLDHGEATLELRPHSWHQAAEVRLGPMTDIRAKGLAALAVLGAIDRDVAYLDVSVPTRPVTG